MHACVVLNRRIDSQLTASCSMIKHVIDNMHQSECPIQHSERALQLQRSYACDVALGLMLLVERRLDDPHVLDAHAFGYKSTTSKLTSSRLASRLSERQ